MTFKDYYSILHLDISASDSDIRNAFKKQALRWHPDKNKGFDTTTKMQEINEAYLILKDLEARARYDTQYMLFKQSTKVVETHSEHSRTKSNTETFAFETSDEILKEWMETAHKQSIGLAQEFIDELRGAGKRAIIGAGESFIGAIQFYLIVGGVFFLFILLSKSCH